MSTSKDATSVMYAGNLLNTWLLHGCIHGADRDGANAV